MREDWVFSVEALNEYVRRSLAADPMLRHIRLRGELSNFKRHSSGHWYFTLKDEAAAVNCAMFRQSAMSVSFLPQDGQSVILVGSVGLYAKTGQYQFYADEMLPGGLGELYLRFEALKERLGKEGLFDPSRKKPLPLLPRGVGIVTSRTGAVVHDICTVAWRRNPSMPLYLCPVNVQGEQAAGEIVRGLQTLDDLPQVEVIIVGRGGGSLEDLWAFNEEAVARAIFACRKPVISAVGHETDVTISDFVADVRAATPSAAAELAVMRRDELLSAARQPCERMRSLCEAALARNAAELARLENRLVRRNPTQYLQQIRSRLELLLSGMTARVEQRMGVQRFRVQQLATRLEAASPNTVLQRGYAIVTTAGRPVTSKADVSVGDEINVRVQDGAFVARVAGKESENAQE